MPFQALADLCKKLGKLTPARRRRELAQFRVKYIEPRACGSAYPVYRLLLPDVREMYPPLICLTASAPPKLGSIAS